MGFPPLNSPSYIIGQSFKWKKCFPNKSSPMVQSRWWTRIGKESREIRGNFSFHVQFWRSRGGSRGLGRWRLPLTAESLRAVCSLHIGFDQVNRFLTIFLKIFLQYFVRTIVNIVIFWYWIESFSRYILWMYYLPIVVQWFLLFPLCLLSHAKFPGVSAGERFPADAPENVSRMADGRQKDGKRGRMADGRLAGKWLHGANIASGLWLGYQMTRVGLVVVENKSQKSPEGERTRPWRPGNQLQNFNFEIT